MNSQRINKMLKMRRTRKIFKIKQRKRLIQVLQSSCVLPPPRPSLLVGFRISFHLFIYLFIYFFLFSFFLFRALLLAQSDDHELAFGGLVSTSNRLRDGTAMAVLEDAGDGRVLRGCTVHVRATGGCLLWVVDHEVDRLTDLLPGHGSNSPANSAPCQ